MAENQRGWGQQGQQERYEQSRDEHRGRDEDQHRYQGSENRYNTPGFRQEQGGRIPYGSSGVPSGYGQGSGWRRSEAGGWGSSGYGGPGYGAQGYRLERNPGFSSGYENLHRGVYGSQQYGRGLGSSGSWGGSSGALGGTEYGSRNAYSSGYGGYQSYEHPRWQEQQHEYGDRGFWDKTKDEVSSWFGDEEAERRREFDRRMSDLEESRWGMEEYGRYSPTIVSNRGKGPKAYRRSDERIREDISDRLSDDERIDASEIEIQVHDAEVTLMGTVDSRESKRRAEDIAEMVSGVQHVQNNIRVNREGAAGSRSASQGISSATSSNTATSSGTSEMTGTTGASSTGTQGTGSRGPGSSTGLTNSGKPSSGTTGKEK